MIKKKSPKWITKVYYDGSMYHGYSVHTNGKVEKSCRNSGFGNAVLGADELTHMLNLYHRYGGKYKGVDVIVGKEIPEKKVKEVISYWKEKFKEYDKAVNKKK